MHGHCLTYLFMLQEALSYKNLAVEEEEEEEEEGGKEGGEEGIGS